MAELFLPVNKCIYCGRSQNECKLKKEHIIPYSLNGDSFLPKASCGECEKTTSAIEGRVVSKMFKSVRLVDNIRSRKPKERPVNLVLDGGIKMPVDQLLGTYPTIHLPPPGFLHNVVNNHSLISPHFGILFKEPKNKSGWSEFDQDKFSFPQTFEIDTYLLFIAKIAHCIAVGNFGIDNFDSLLPPFILGKNTNNISYLIGGIPEIKKPFQIQHEIIYELVPYNTENNNLYYISIKFRLFSYIGGPHVHVIAGVTDKSRFNRIMLHIGEHKIRNRVLNTH